MKTSKSWILALFFMSILCSGCSSSDEDTVGCFSCLYEKQSTGCNNSNYGEWEDGFITIDEPREGLDPQQFCNEQFPPSDLECVSGCCVSFRFRNVRVGPCQ